MEKLNMSARLRKMLNTSDKKQCKVLETSLPLFIYRFPQAALKCDQNTFLRNIQATLKREYFFIFHSFLAASSTKSCSFQRNLEAFWKPSGSQSREWLNSASKTHCLWKFLKSLCVKLQEHSIAFQAALNFMGTWHVRSGRELKCKAA